ncbi:MAG: type II toxin-antitoxin system VapC family toxin [Acidimicrobiia bacterium]
MKIRFADTSFWFARHVATDRRHEEARRIRPGPHVVTTEWVLGETWTLVNRRVGHGAARACVEAIRRLPGVDIEPVTIGDLSSAWRWLERHDEREYSFVDAVSFSVMRRRRLTEALAFDGDFTAAGFVEVRPG